MKSVRFPLAALMGLVFLCAFGFTALRSGSELCIPRFAATWST